MRRRDFIAGLMIAAVTRQAQAQQTGKVYRIAFAHPTVPVADQNQASKGSLAFPAIFEELTRLGYVEGRSLLVERYCETMARNARRLLAHCGLRGEQSNDTID